jgi:hypothetical protein
LFYVYCIEKTNKRRKKGKRKKEKEKKKEKMDTDEDQHWAQLPSELWIYILSFLPFVDTLRGIFFFVCV